MDDGSRDDTPERMLHRYGEEPRVRYIRQQTAAFAWPGIAVFGRFEESSSQCLIPTIIGSPGNSAFRSVSSGLTRKSA